MRIAGVALALSGVALGVGVLALTRESAQPPRQPVRMDRVAVLEAQVAELTRELEILRSGRTEPVEAGAPRPPFVPEGAEAGPAERRADVAARDPDLEAIVDDAVARKTEKVLDEMRIKANKKPAIDVLASMLELSREQRAVTERVVVEGQREVHKILDTPTYDGTNLMDQLVEVAARGVAEPGKDHGWGRWLARVISEKIPGTDETYGARIESVKSAMRRTFQREWTESQYREFEEWGVDPIEIAKVPGSPNEALRVRITERAGELGADLPKD